ncbi:lipoprotein [Streptomyces zinciresistens K42]|uniref:Lipoprotein n=1 Tax=Streptomyces zinciresistens K42 TaxID=700597 RepID=G2G8X5_9ACTN|nr:L,D-transpeptidase family protein [Streptomyces zinciresistens]EGX60037.1 lipoprotein [Streptomyces zinciresistens K42]
MRNGGVRRAAATTAAVVGLLTVLTVLTACEGAREGAGSGASAGADAAGAHAAGAARARSASPVDPTRVPGVGARWQRRIPVGSRQVVAVYGEGRNSPDATIVLYLKRGTDWERVRGWPGHNGKKGWTPDHREGDDRSPVGVFTLSDAGGVLKDPGSKLPYTRSPSFAAPRWWAKSYWRDFDYVIAVDYNRVKGTPPNDPVRPQGRRKGGGIWLHMDHGSGTSACVSLSESGMRYLLRTLDPALRPVAVMGDKAALKRRS